MTTFNHCRFCDDWQDQNLVRYSTRHLAHFKCYLDAGKELKDLRPWQVAQFPYFLLKERGLLDEAERIAAEEKKNNRLAEKAWRRAIET